MECHECKVLKIYIVISSFFKHIVYVHTERVQALLDSNDRCDFDELLSSRTDELKRDYEYNVCWFERDREAWIGMHG